MDTQLTASSLFTDLKSRIEARKARVGIIGLGYVGLPLALLYSEQKFPVTGFDIDQRKIDMLRRGESPIYEPGLTELLRLSTSRIRCTTRGFEALPEADVIFITVGTPFQSDYGKHSLLLEKPV